MRDFELHGRGHGRGFGHHGRGHCGSHGHRDDKRDDNTPKAQ
ncbi:hypothetical protein [Enterobacter bugandensis]|nr:hypothetical protein [Enterobacter bugandensis]WRT52096.1 hypothetical protein VK758_03075 [Enterobacter bugandensis]